MAGAFTKGPTHSFYIDEAKVIYPWFSGEETPMNRAGDRNFGLVLSKAQADELLAAGYNVKTREAKEATDEYDAREATYFVKCKLNFNGRKPPRVVLVTCDPVTKVCKRDPISESTVGLLDTADIEKVDCKIRPYDRQESNTRTAYVESLFVTVNLDKFDAKYDDIPWAGDSGPIPDDPEED